MDKLTRNLKNLKKLVLSNANRFLAQTFFLGHVYFYIYQEKYSRDFIGSFRRILAILAR